MEYSQAPFKTDSENEGKKEQIVKGLWVSFCWPKQNFDFYKCSFMALFSLHASLILTPSGLAKQQLSSLCYCVYAYVHVYVSVCAPRKDKLFEDIPLFRQYIATSPTKAVIHCHTERSTESIVLLIGQASPIQRVGNENERLCCFTENGPVHPRKKNAWEDFYCGIQWARLWDKLSPYYPFAHKRWQL